jgi:hypothetical protein
MDENSAMEVFTNTFVRKDDESPSNYQSLKKYLNDKKIVLLSFRNYLKKIIDGIDSGNYNLKMLIELTEIINDYYKKHESDVDTDEESSSKSSEKARKNSETSSLDKLSDSEEFTTIEEMMKGKNVSFVEDKEEKKEDTEKKVHNSSPKVVVQTDPLMDAFINSNHEMKRPRIINTSYDTLNNINTFIKKSLVY